MPNGPPSGPEPPRMSMPPLIVLKWSCTFAAFVAWTPPPIVAVCTGWSSLPNTTVPPCWTNRPDRIVTGPSLRQTPFCGTTTRWYVPGASVPSQVVVPPLPKAGATTKAVATSAPRQSKKASLLIGLLPFLADLQWRNTVDDSAAPVCDDQAAGTVVQQCEGVREPGREGCHQASVSRTEVDSDDPAAEPVAQVLAPLGDEEIAVPERDPVRRGVRFEVGDGRSDTVAPAARPERARVRPAARPAVEGPFPHRDHHLGGLGIGVGPEVVLAVHRRVQPAGPGLEREPVRVPQAARDHAQVAPVGPQREDRRAAGAALVADVARRAATPVEPAVRPDHDVVLLVLAERNPLDDAVPPDQPAAAQDEPFE